VLGPISGLLGGLTGAGLMLAFIALTQSLTRVGVADVLTALGAVGNIGSHLMVGGALHFSIGGVLGLLYALCEQRGPRRGLIFVCAFYGFVLWVLGAVIAASFLNEAARGTLRTVPFLLACLFYGLWLALLAIWADSRHPAATAVPKD